jgi:hypothetical protein
MSRKPSMTICPDRVAVTVEFSPQHRSAMANSVGAKAEPSNGERKECTSSSSATLVCASESQYLRVVNAPPILVKCDKS